MSLPPLPEDFAGNPSQPAPWTTREPREGLRDTDAARIVSLAPDVCLTPIGSSSVPVPYPVVDFCGHDHGYAQQVNFTGHRAMVLRSRTTHVHGDAPGTHKGVKSGTVEDITEPVGHAAEVRAEGSHVIRHLDRFTMNSGNTVGEAIFTRSTATDQPPTDDDPIPGSLRLSAASPSVQFAQLATPTMSGAGISNFAGPAPGANGQAHGGGVATAGGRGTVASPTQQNRPAPQQRVPASPRVPLGPLLRRFGIFGLVIEDALRTASLPLEEQQAEAVAQGIRMSPAGRAVTRMDRLLGGQSHNPNPLSIFWRSSWEGKYGVFIGPEERIPLGNDILSRLAGRRVDLRSITQAELQEVLSPYAGLSEEQVEERLRERDRRRAKAETSVPRPVPIAPGSNVRVDEDENRRCRTRVICFLPVSQNIDRAEFDRQMELQQNGINAMTPQQLLANRAAYLADPVGMRAQSEPLQERARREYLTSPRVIQSYLDQYGPIQGLVEHRKYLDAAAALHNPDMVAGGAFNSVVDPNLPIESRIGTLNANSSMGSQWVNPNRNGNTRATRLAEHAERQARNNCPSVQINMRICQSDPNYPGKPTAGSGIDAR